MNRTYEYYLLFTFVCTFISAPFDNRKSTTSAQPYCAAKINAVSSSYGYELVHVDGELK